MGTIILHAGMPKAGSSSIQRWLRDHDDEVRRAHWHMLAYRLADEHRAAELSAPIRRRINSGTFVRRYNASHRSPAVLDELFQPLDRMAHDKGRVLLSSEGFARLFAEPDFAFLERLDALAVDHDVRVAYYVRPQHQSIEAAWRQWGFRQQWNPRGYIELRARLLSYADTLEHVGQLAPNVCFEMRLFDPSASVPRDIVADFLQQFLGISEVDAAATEVWANPGLPLELANALRDAQPGRFWSSAHNNAKIRPLKQIAAGWSIPPTPEIARSRLILQQYCHERFEEGNGSLARRLGWPVEHLVPPVEDAGITHGGLDELNALWSSHQSAAERELLYQSLERLLEIHAETAPAAPMGAGTIRTGGAARSAPPPGTDAGAQRARRGRSWLENLERSIPGGAAQLVRRPDGLVFLVDGMRRRPIRSGLLVTVLETAIGTTRAEMAEELDAMEEGPPVELFEDSRGQPFVIYGGQRHKLRGMPLPHRVDNVDKLPNGTPIDVTPSRREKASSPDGDQWARSAAAARARKWLSFRRR
jgi:hypothetical protein